MTREGILATARTDVPCRVVKRLRECLTCTTMRTGIMPRIHIDTCVSRPMARISAKPVGSQPRSHWKFRRCSTWVPIPPSWKLAGSGGYALHLAEKLGCQIVGLDINEPGIRSAKELAQRGALASRARFEQCDVSTNLPFGDQTFDAAFSNDVLCHVPGRLDLLVEIFRVLKPSGRLLFSDALVIGGMVSAEEIAIRSSIGFYFYSPPGENERLLEQAGFSQVRTADTTENAARISKRWHDAREKWKAELVTAEGSPNFEGLQRFLSCAHTLTSERRLLRYLYFARKTS